MGYATLHGKAIGAMQKKSTKQNLCQPETSGAIF